jgi:predicted ABC-type ATPase
MEEAQMTSKPIALILAGPNGAGKTTVSSVFVSPDVEFVNADIIGAELRRDDPHRPGADVTGGRIVSARLRALAAERRSFCFETNLASPGLVGRIDAWRADGYEVRLVFVSLPNVDLALARVAARVAAGGHDVPEETVRRRFTAGLRYFFTLYRFRVDLWTLYDNSSGSPALVAGGRGGGAVVTDERQWKTLGSIAVANTGPQE